MQVTGADAQSTCGAINNSGKLLVGPSIHHQDPNFATTEALSAHNTSNPMTVTGDVGTHDHTHYHQNLGNCHPTDEHNDQNDLIVQEVDHHHAGMFDVHQAPTDPQTSTAATLPPPTPTPSPPPQVPGEVVNDAWGVDNILFAAATVFASTRYPVLGVVPYLERGKDGCNLEELQNLAAICGISDAAKAYEGLYLHMTLYPTICVAQKVDGVWEESQVDNPFHNVAHFRRLNTTLRAITESALDLACSRRGFQYDSVKGSAANDLNKFWRQWDYLSSETALAEGHRPEGMLEWGTENVGIPFATLVQPNTILDAAFRLLLRPNGRAKLLGIPATQVLTNDNSHLLIASIKNWAYFFYVLNPRPVKATGNNPNQQVVNVLFH